MKLIALLVASLVVALMPLAAPPQVAGQGDAAAAVAAHGLGVAVQPGGVHNGTLAFKLAGGGTIVHPHGVTAGAKPFKNKVALAQITDCIAGAAAGCSPATLEINEGDPTAYLFFDSLTSWRIATNAAGDDATELEGLVDGKGGFMFTGAHTQSGTELLISGKVSFNKGTLTPKKIVGKISAVAQGQEHYGTGNFHTTGLAP